MAANTVFSSITANEPLQTTTIPAIHTANTTTTTTTTTLSTTTTTTATTVEVDVLQERITINPPDDTVTVKEVVPEKDEDNSDTASEGTLLDEIQSDVISELLQVSFFFYLF